MSDAMPVALVVDDDPICRSVLVFALQHQGFSCDSAKDGQEGECKLHNRDYDLVVTDLRMPKRHGRALAENLMKQQHRPVIIVHTSVHDPSVTTELMSIGIDDITIKPCHYAAFAAKAMSLVKRRAAVTQRSGLSNFLDTIPAVPQDREEQTWNGNNRYRLIRTLGQGSMAVVYLAEDLRLCRRIALKIMRPEQGTEDVGQERFLREAKLAAALRHPGICPVYDVGVFGSTYYIAMAYVAGHTLDKFVKPPRLPHARQIAVLMRKIAQAMQHAHTRGVVHRDLKPSNIIISREGGPVIADFGLAFPDSGKQIRLTNPGQILGTPAYMSPEQATDKIDTIGAATDIYSLGVIAYQLLTGRLPFEGSVIGVLQKILAKEPPLPSEVHPGVDPFLEELCMSMIAKNIEDRPASMNSVAGMLGAYLKKGKTSMVLA